MTECQISNLNNGENNLCTLLGNILLKNSLHISQKIGTITCEKLYPKLVLLSSINDNMSYGFFTFNGNNFICMTSTIKFNGIDQKNFCLPKFTTTYNYLINKKKMTDYEILFNTTFYCSFTPIIDYISSNLIGCLFVGVNKSQIKNNSQLSITKEISPLTYIDNAKIMIKNIFGDIIIINNTLFSYNRGALIENNTKNVLNILTEQINYKSIFITLFNFINQTFTQISSSENNRIHEISQQSNAYQQLINKLEHCEILNEYEINYYVCYVPIIDTNTGFLIGAFYFKFGPFNMI
jgi:hypothetical protein